MIWAFYGIVGTFFIALLFLDEENRVQIRGVSIVTTKAFCRRRASVARRLTSDALAFLIVLECSIRTLFIALESEWVSPWLCVTFLTKCAELRSKVALYAW